MDDALSDDEEARQWQQRYESGRTGWDRGEPSPALLTWLDEGLFRQVKSVLIPGCGRGYEVVELASRGFDVTALDIAPTPLAELSDALKQRSIKANLVEGNLFDFNPSQPFDLVYEQTCLCAIEPQERTNYEAQLAKWIKPGGVLLALFMQTDNNETGPPYHCSPLDMANLFSTRRWEWSPDTKIVEHPAGLKEIAAVLRRPERIEKNELT